MLLKEIESYKNLEILARQVVEGFITGLHKSPFHGFSVEFAEHRQYNAGESTKNIDWKLYGRTDKVFVKRFEEETNLRCRILLDVSPSMYYPEKVHSKLKFATLAAASIAQLLKKQRDAFGLSTFDSAIREHTEMRSSPQHFRMILSKLQQFWEALAPAAQTESSKISEALEYIAATSNRRSLIVIFSDMLDSENHSDAVWAALQQLRFQKNEIILFHIAHSPEESELNFPSRPFRFEDIETGEKLIVNPAEIRDAYRVKSEAFQKEIREKCMQYRIDFHPIDVSKDLHQVLLPFYVKRMRMG